MAVFLAGTVSMFAGASVVHAFLKPDLTLPEIETPVVLYCPGMTVNQIKKCKTCIKISSECGTIAASNRKLN